MHGPASKATPSPAAPPLATWRELVGLCVLVLPALLIAIDMTVLHLAVPHLAADLRPTSTELLWIIDIYGFFIAGSLVTMGSLGDRIGRRKLLLIGASVFSVTSVLAAFATTPAMLIAARALLGISAATLMPSTLSLIRNMFHDERHRGLANAIWLSLFMGGGSAGPVLGGIVLEHWWWGAVFLINVPVMVLLLIIGPLLLPEYKQENAGRLDIMSALLATLAVMVAVYGIKEATVYGITPLAVLAMAAGVGIGFLFARRQTRLSDPMISPELFRNSAFRATLITQSLIVLAFSAPMFLTNQYMQLVMGLSAFDAALHLVPALILGTCGSLVAPWLAGRSSQLAVICGGLVMSTAGFAILTQAPTVDGYAIVITGFTLAIFGANGAITLLTNAILGAAPPERAGEASGISETSLELSHALGIAVIGSVAAAVYRAVVADTLPATLPAVALTAGRESLFSAAAVAADMGGSDAAVLMAAARDAFVSGLHVTAGIGLVLMAALTLLSVTLLRHATAGTASAQQ